MLYANNSRGKLEAAILGGMSQIMLTLSRLAQDLMIFTMRSLITLNFRQLLYRKFDNAAEAKSGCM